MNRFKVWIKLAEPRTWMASILPVLYGSALSWHFYQGFKPLSFILLLIGMICVQSLANMFNDYKDFSRAADNSDKSDEKALASGETNICTVKRMMLITLSFAVVSGVLLAFLSSPSILFVALVGIIVLFLYSSGPKPICYTPFGEITAGITMGIGITATVMFIQADHFHWYQVILSIPTAIFTGMLLLSNNLADWQEDKVAGRQTLPIILGTKFATILWSIGSIALFIFGIFFLLNNFLFLAIPTIILLGSTFGYFIAKYSGVNKIRSSKPILMKLTTNLGMFYHFVCIFVIFIKHFIS